MGTTFSDPLEVSVTGLGDKSAANVPVTFAIVAGGAGGSFAGMGSPTVVTVDTNASGVATAPTLTANSMAGSYFVSIAVQGVVIPGAFSETNKPGAAVSITAAAGANQTATVGTVFAHPLEVIVQDPYGNVVPNTSVTFTAPTGGATGTFSVTGSPKSVTVKTNAAGLATAPAFTAGKIAGAYTVTASAGDLTTSLSETNGAGAPAVLTVTGGSGQETSVNAAFADTLEVTVRDRFGNLLANVPVTFTAPSTGAGVTFAEPGSPSQVVVTTNAAGVATTPTLMANNTAGSFIVTASVAGVKKGVSFQETNGE